MFDRILDGFQQANPRFTVERQYTTTGLQQVAARIYGEAAADAQRVNNDTIFTLLSTGALRGMDDYYKRDIKRADYYAIVFTSRVGPGDEIGASVVGAAPSVVFYNTEHLRQVGVTAATDWGKTWTIEQFEAALQKLVQFHRQGGATDRWAYHDEPKSMQYHLWNNGFRPYNADETRATFLTPPAVDLLTIYQDWYCRKGYGMPIPLPPGDDPTRAFREGRLSLYLAGMDLAASFPKDLPWDVAPVFKGKTAATTENAERCWAIPNHSKVHDDAWLLLKWLHGKPAQEEFAKIDWAVPVLKSVAEGPVFNDAARAPKHRNVLHQAVANDVPSMNNPMADEYQAWFTRTTSDLRSCAVTPQDFLRERERLANDKIAETKWNRQTNWRKGWRTSK
jgi:ABC-type glycerol-3-phosphate transport system substrate-binding protein